MADSSVPEAQLHVLTAGMKPTCAWPVLSQLEAKEWTSTSTKKWL